MTEVFAILGLGVACILWFLIQQKTEEVCGEPEGGTPEGCGACSVPSEARDCGPIEIGR